MTDITPEFNKLLMGLNAPPTVDPSLTLQNIDEFLREAYRIVCLTKIYSTHAPYLLSSSEFAHSFIE